MRKGLNDPALLQRTKGHDEAIREIFRHYSESDMTALDSRIPDDEWWIDEQRVAYVRKNRDAFRGIK
jgi:hypothetical protein